MAIMQHVVPIASAVSLLAPDFDWAVEVFAFVAADEFWELGEPEVGPDCVEPPEGVADAPNVNDDLAVGVIAVGETVWHSLAKNDVMVS